MSNRSPAYGSATVGAGGIRKAAADWIRGELEDGPRPARDILCTLYNLDIPDWAIKYAKLRLGVQVRQVGRHWYWALRSEDWEKDFQRVGQPRT